MAKTRIVTPKTGSKRKKSCQTEALGSSLDKTLSNCINWDWFVSKLWRDQLWQTTFAGDLTVWRPHRVPTRSPVTTLLLWVHTVEDDLQEIVSFSQSAAVWLCQQVQFDSKCFPLSNRLSIVLFTDGGSVTSERSTFWGLGRRTMWFGQPHAGSAVAILRRTSHCAESETARFLPPFFGGTQHPLGLLR